LLLDSNADFYSDHKADIVDIAVQNGNKEAVKMLLDLPASSPRVDNIKDYFGVLHRAITSGNTEMAELILGYGITLDDDDPEWAGIGYNYIMQDIIKDIPMIDFLLRSNEIPLDMAFLMYDVIASILDFDCNPYLNLLQIAVKQHEIETVKFLLRKGMVCDDLDLVYHSLVDESGEYHEAKTLSMLKFLDEIECDFHERNEQGFMPIHCAAICSSPAVLEYILNKGSDINDITAPKRDSLLHLAVRHENLEIVNYLISKGVNINIRNNDCKSPIDEALQESQDAAIKLIIAGADLSDVIDDVVRSKDDLLKECSLPQKIAVLGNLLFATDDKDLCSEFVQNIELFKQRILLAGEPKMVIEMKDLFPKIKTTHTTEKDVECLCSVVSKTMLQNLDLFRGVMVSKMSRDILNELRDGYITDDYLGDAMESIFPKIPESIKVLILNDSLRQDFRKDVMKLDAKAKGLKRSINDVNSSKIAKIDDSGLFIKCLSGIISDLGPLADKIGQCGKTNIVNAFSNFLNTVVNESNALIESSLEADISKEGFVKECLGEEEGSLS